MSKQKRIIEQLKKEIREKEASIKRETNNLTDYMQRYNLDFEILREMRTFITIEKRRKQRLERQLKRFTQKTAF